MREEDTGILNEMVLALKRFKVTDKTALPTQDVYSRLESKGMIWPIDFDGVRYWIPTDHGYLTILEEFGAQDD